MAWIRVVMMVWMTTMADFSLADGNRWSLDGGRSLAPGTLAGSGLQTRVCELPTIVDHLEVNHKVCRYTGQLAFVQVIAWRWNDEYRRMEVVSYHVVHDERSLDALPRQMAGSWWEWSHAMAGGATVYRAPSCTQTWTTEDPEQVNLRVLPQAARAFVWPIVR